MCLTAGFPHHLAEFRERTMRGNGKRKEGKREETDRRRGRKMEA